MRVFVTGASGWIGLPLTAELLDAGHRVIGLARSEVSATSLAAAGAEVLRADLDDLDSLRRAAAESDGVIHLAFKHDIAFTRGFQEAADADRRAIEALGGALAGTDRPFVIASGVAGLTPGRVATERDGLRLDSESAHLSSGLLARQSTANWVLSLASQGVRSAVVRLSPTVHGAGDHGFVASLVSVAREKGASGYVGEGNNRWPAVHRLDAAHLFRLALEQAPAGSVLHGVADEGVPIRAIAEVIGRHLNVPVVPVTPENAGGHFGWLGALIGVDTPASSALTRDLVGWQPTHPGLIADLEEGHYFRHATA